MAAEEERMEERELPKLSRKKRNRRGKAAMEKNKKGGQPCHGEKKESPCLAEGKEEPEECVVGRKLPKWS